MKMNSSAYWNDDFKILTTSPTKTCLALMVILDIDNSEWPVEIKNRNNKTSEWLNRIPFPMGKPIQIEPRGTLSLPIWLRRFDLISHVALVASRKFSRAIIPSRWQQTDTRSQCGELDFGIEAKQCRLGWRRRIGSEFVGRKRRLHHVGRPLQSGAAEQNLPGRPQSQDRISRPGSARERDQLKQLNHSLKGSVLWPDLLTH